MKRAGMRMTDIARRLDISYSTVKDIVYRRHKPWKPSGAAVSRPSPTAEAADLKSAQVGVRISGAGPSDPLAQLAEATVSNTVQSRFKSGGEHQIGSK